MSGCSEVGQEREERDRARAGATSQDPLGRPMECWGEMEACSPGLALPDSGLGSTPANHSPASCETHPLVWSNVLASDHCPGKGPGAVAQVADLESEHRRQETPTPHSQALRSEGWPSSHRFWGGSSRRALGPTHSALSLW